MNREIFVWIYVYWVDDILLVLCLVDEFNLDVCIEYCIEGYLIVKELGGRNLKVSVGLILICCLKVELKNKIWKIY